MSIANQADIRSSLNDVDFLPSVNFVYQLSNNMNIRTAASRTLARPMFREKMPLATYEFDYDYKFRGNPDLERTLISNYDLRWEYFIRPGEILAVSAYYKYFDRPITRFIVDINGNLEPRNVEWGKVYGLEFEIRSRLDRVSSLLRNFTLGSNVSLIDSEIKVGQDEIDLARREDPDFAETRDMQGQSPYIVNVDLSFSNNSTTASLIYNVFGERMTEVALASIPDVYEQPFHSLNFTASQKVLGNFKVSFSATNILDESVLKTQTLNGVEYTESEYRYGRSFSIGTSYSF
jgi:outer membrane receptor protein involved in Fe transport